MGQQLPDVQATRPEVPVGLGRVGVTGVEKLVEIDRPEKRPYVLMERFDAFVDLPGWRKGADMGRNMEVVDEILQEAVGGTALRVEDVCGDAAERLLEKHDYTTRAEVRMEAEFAVREFLQYVPQAGHAQRGHATLTVETDGAPPVDLLELIEVARDAMSARIYNLAKRPDEDHVTLRAHANAKFVEDCVRSMADGVVEAFPDLPEDAIVTMKQSNAESIHQHNPHAERVAEVGTIRAELAAAG